MSYLAVFVGGGAGAVLRYLLGRWAVVSGREVLWATLATNFVACLLLGYLLYSAGRQADTPASRLLLATGFCGGFSTFSTFGAEAYALVGDGRAMHAAVYVVASVVLGLLVYTGARLG